MPGNGLDDMMRFAMKTLSTQRLSTRQLTTLLNQTFAHSRHCNDWVQMTLTRLAEYDILDDTQMAEQITLRHMAKGNAFIRERLGEAGFNDDAIETVIAKLAPEYHRAMQAAQNQWAYYEQNNIDDREDKLRKFLFNRGFCEVDYAKILAAVQAA